LQSSHCLAPHTTLVEQWLKDEGISIAGNACRAKLPTCFALQVEQWLKGDGSTIAGNAWELLAPLRQAAEFLLLLEKHSWPLDYIHATTTPSLTRPQLHRLATQFRDVTVHPLRSMKVLQDVRGRVAVRVCQSSLCACCAPWPLIISV
jgi:hypothetical protein